MQQLEQAQLGQPAKQGAAQGRKAAEDCQLQAEQAQRLAARQAQAAQQGTGIETAGSKAAGRQGHGHAREQYGDQAGHVQVTLGLAQGAADLLVAIARILQALVGRQRLGDAVPVVGQGLGLAAPQVAVADPAAGLHHAGGVEVGQVDQYPRRQAVEVAGAVRFVGQYPAHAQGFHADVDAVADFQVQGCQQAGLDPGLAGCRATAAGFAGVGFGGAAQFAS
ncbi:hypothetical protein D3C77_435140 [compost metagenome]